MGRSSRDHLRWVEDGDRRRERRTARGVPELQPTADERHLRHRDDVVVPPRRVRARRKQADDGRAGPALPIRLRHPVHGLKIAISDMEAAMDYEHGWEEYDPLELTAQQDEPVASSEPNQLKRRRKAVAAEA